MASGVIKGTTSNNFIKSKIEWTSEPIDGENSSRVTATMYLWRTNGYVTTGTGQFTISVGGTNIIGTKKYWSISTSEVAVVSGTVVVPHDSDGSKSVVISGSGSIPDTSLSSVSCGGTAVLDTLVKTTAITKVDGGHADSPIKVTLYPSDTSLYTRLVISPDEINITRDIGRLDSEQTVEITLTEGERSDLYSTNTTGDSLDLKIQADSYRDEQYTDFVASDIKDLFLDIPDSDETKPILNNVEFHPITLGYNENELYWGDVYVQGRSRVKASVVATGRYGATIVSTTMTVQGKTYESPFESDPISSYGTVNVEVRCTDSRGFTAVYSENISVYPYSIPRVLPLNGKSEIECFRCNEDGTYNSGGSCLYISARREYTYLDGKNECSLWVRVKGEVGSAERVTLISKDSTATEYIGKVEGVTLDTRYPYSVSLVAEDALDTSQTVTKHIPKDTPTFVRGVGGNKASFGGYPEADNMLDVYWDLRVRGKLYLDGADSVIEAGEKDGWYYRKWSSGWAECYGSVDISTDSTSWGSLYVGRTYANKTFPFDFAEIPNIIASVKPNGSPGWVMPHGSNAGSTTETGNYTVVAGNSFNREYTISFDVKGYYKKD